MKRILTFLIFCLTIFLGFASYKVIFNEEKYAEVVTEGKENIIKFAENLQGSEKDEPLILEELKPMLSVDDITYPSEPKTVEDFKKVFLNMANNNTNTISLGYDESYKKIFHDSSEIEDNVSTAFDEVVVEYVDLFSGTNKLDLKMEGNLFSSTLDITLSTTNKSDEDFIKNQIYFEKQCRVINSELHKVGDITEDMSEKEIAKDLFTYVTTTLEYDVDLKSESFTGYGAITNNEAVCQGYTAYYNYLLKLNGIECFGQSGEILENGTLHIWTVATLDNEKSYIDVTFGDPVPDKIGYTDYEYFDVGPEFLAETRTGVE